MRQGVHSSYQVNNVPRRFNFNWVQLWDNAGNLLVYTLTYITCRLHCSYKLYVETSQRKVVTVYRRTSGQNLDTIGQISLVNQTPPRPPFYHYGRMIKWRAGRG